MSSQPPVNYNANSTIPNASNSTNASTGNAENNPPSKGLFSGLFNWSNKPSTPAPPSQDGEKKGWFWGGKGKGKGKGTKKAKKNKGGKSRKNNKKQKK